MLLPMKTDVTPLGESRSLAVRRFKAFKCSLRAKCQFNEFAVTMREYFEMGHAEPVSVSELKRQCNEVYYFLMHTVRKESSTTSKVRVVFNAYVKSSSGMLLNDQLLVRPTVHSSLVDVWLWFQRHKVALTTDVQWRCQRSDWSGFDRITFSPDHFSARKARQVPVIARHLLV